MICEGGGQHDHHRGQSSEEHLPRGDAESGHRQGENICVESDLLLIGGVA